MSYNKDFGEIDDMECRLNLAIYPLIIDLILNEPEIAEKLSGKSIRLK